MSIKLNKKCVSSFAAASFICFSAFSVLAVEGGVYRYPTNSYQLNPGYNPIAHAMYQPPNPGYDPTKPVAVDPYARSVTYHGDGSNTAKFFNPQLQAQYNPYAYGMVPDAYGQMPGEAGIYGDGWEVEGSFNLRYSDFYFLTAAQSYLHWDNMRVHEFEGNIKKVFPNIGSLPFNEPFVFGQVRFGSITDGRSVDDDLKNELYDISVGGVDGDTSVMKFGFGFKADFGEYLAGFDVYPVVGYARHVHDLKMLDQTYPNPKYPVAWTPGGGNFEDNQEYDSNWYLSEGSSDGIPDGFQTTAYDGWTYGGYGVYSESEDDNILTLPTIVDKDADDPNRYNFYVDFGAELDGGDWSNISFEAEDYIGAIIYDPESGLFETDGICEYDAWNVADNGYATPNCLFTGGYDVSLSGVTQHYKVVWDGLYIGATIERKFNDTDKFSLYGDVGYYWYKAEADWPLRNDYQHPLSFVDEGSGLGMTFNASYTHAITESILLKIGVDGEYFALGSADSTLYLSDQARDENGNIIGAGEQFEANFLDEARWRSFAFKLGAVYRF